MVSYVGMKPFVFMFLQFVPFRPRIRKKQFNCPHFKQYFQSRLFGGSVAEGEHFECCMAELSQYRLDY